MKAYYCIKAIIVLMAFFVSAPAPSQIVVEKPLSKRITGYKLDVTLSDRDALISGSINAFWVNISPVPVREIHMHMYMNAFRSNMTTYFGSAGVKPRKGRDAFGWVDFLTAADGSGHDLMDAMEFIAPDDSNRYDMTVLRINLREPVEPGDTFRLKGTFETKLPSVIRRTGYSNDFFFVAQWFPKFGVFEPVKKGEGPGEWDWNCHQFHSASEFYSNHSVYEVNITLPEKYVVGSGGMIQSDETLPDGNKRLSFRAEDIVDFAWTAWPDYEVYHDRWNHVGITLLIAPGRKSQVERHLGAVRNTLEYLTENVGPYPWPHMTVVDPPSIGQGAGGMEYTTLFTGSGMSYAPRWFRIPELVTAHELGHSWFMGILASDEAEEPWLDEGVNSFWEQRIMDHYYGDGYGLASHRLLKIPDRSLGRFQYVISGVRQVTDNTPYSWQYPQGSYGMMSYQKAAVWLHNLMGIIGEETMNEVFREYYRKWSFRHPSRNDFTDVVNEVVTRLHGNRFGENLDWFFEQTLYGTGICDYKVHRFFNTEVYPYTGIERAGDSTVIVKSDPDDQPLRYRSVVQLQRVGEVILPVDVRIGFSNGEVTDTVWDGRERYKNLIYERNENIKVVWVKLDPDFKNQMDVNIRNNSLTLESDRKPLLRFARKLAFLLQLVFNFIMI